MLHAPQALCTVAKAMPDCFHVDRGGTAHKSSRQASGSSDKPKACLNTMLEAASRRLPPHCRSDRQVGGGGVHERAAGNESLSLPCEASPGACQSAAQHMSTSATATPHGPCNGWSNKHNWSSKRSPNLLTSTLAQSVRGSTPHCSLHPASVCLVLNGSFQNLRSI